MRVCFCFNEEAADHHPVPVARRPDFVDGAIHYFQRPAADRHRVGEHRNHLRAEVVAHPVAVAAVLDCHRDPAGIRGAPEAHRQAAVAFDHWVRRCLLDGDCLLRVGFGTVEVFGLIARYLVVIPDGPIVRELRQAFVQCYSIDLPTHATA